MLPGERPLDFVVLRLLCVAFSSTWFVPDEVFQSVEIAYRMVYGVGFRTWEWDPDWALRSTLHPLIYASLFRFLRFFRVDFGFFIRWAPHLFHALLFAAADMCYLGWARKLGLSNRVYRLTLTLYSFNWFLLYCSARTLSNTLECCLSIIALNWYQKGGQKALVDHRSLGLCVFCVSVAAILRPTTVLLWVPLLLPRVWHLSAPRGSFDVFALANTLFGLLPFALGPPICSAIFDSLYYQSPVLCLWNFVRFNVFRGGSAHFGTHPWHWYFTQGLPPLLTLSFIPLLTSFFHFRLFHIPKRYAFAALLYIVGHSLIAHKEHRFLLPVLPFLFPYIAQELVSSKVKRIELAKQIYVVLNLLLALYFGLVHQRGPGATNGQLLDIIGQWKSDGGRIKILQLMPCFSLPQYAHLHPYSNITDIRMLDCSTALLEKGGAEADNEDESDAFHANPEGWLNREWYTGKLFDAHIVVAYADIYRKIERFLMQKGFTRHSKIFHTQFTTSSRQSTWIVISIREGTV